MTAAVPLAPLAAASAAGPGEATVAAKGFSVRAGSEGVELASCPAGRRVVGGGVGQTGRTHAYFGAVQESGPVDGSGRATKTESGDVGRSWFVSVYTNPDAGNRDYRAFAICTAESDVTVAAKAFVVEAAKGGGTAAACPPGERALGGGVAQTGKIDPNDRRIGWVELSGPLDASGETAKTASGDVPRSWYASVWNAGGVKRGYKVFVLCASGSDATVAARAFVVERGKIGDAAVSCPAGRRVLGGGVGQVGKANRRLGFVQQSGPLDETGATATTGPGDVARSWLVSVYNAGEASQGRREYKVFAICASSTQRS